MGEAFSGIFGWKLNPMFGAAAMSLSSFCVVTNALRLNWFRMYDTKRDKKRKQSLAGSPMANKQTELSAQEKEESRNKIPNSNMEININNKEEENMTKTMKIEGMMCGHCEARVKKSLEALTEVSEAQVSHETGSAVVTLNGQVSDDVLKKAVEDQDYKVLSIQ